MPSGEGGTRSPPATPTASKIQNGRQGAQKWPIGHSKQLLLNKFFDQSTPSMRKGRDGEKWGEKEEKTRDYSGRYVIARSRPPERRPLERRMLVPICV